MVLKIKNWHRFQHFKDRKPPWVKLYRDLLDDIKWHELAPEAAKTLVSLWLIASEKEGFLPDTKELSFRLRCSKTVIESNISKLSHWLIQDDIKTISDINAISVEHTEDINDIPLARSRETETEIETEKRANGFALPGWVPSEAWNAWLEVRTKLKAPNTTRALTLAIKSLESLREEGHDPQAVLDLATTRGWRGLFAPHGVQQRIQVDA